MSNCVIFLGLLWVLTVFSVKRVPFRKLVGTGETAHHEDLRSKSRTHIKSQVWQCMLAIPSTGEARTGGSSSLLAS